MQVTILNRRPTILGLVSGDRIMPGQKIVISEEAYAKIRVDPTFCSWLKLGWLNIRQSSPTVDMAAGQQDPSKASLLNALQELTAKDAIAMVGKCDKPDLLKAWLELESRKGVLKAIESQLKIMAKKSSSVADGDVPTFGDGAPDDE